MEKHLLKNGKELTIRLVKIEEVQEFLNYINQCGKETNFLGFGEEGIGKNLLNSAIKRGKKTGITRFELTVRTDNKNAIALYNKLGFEIEGRLKNAMFIKDKYFDNYIMGLVI